MTVEEVKTTFIANVDNYKKDIKEAQKALASFLKTSDTSLNKREAAEYKLQTAMQKTTQEQNKATAAASKQSQSLGVLGSDLAHAARNVMTFYYSIKTVASIFKAGIDFNRFTENAEASFRVMTKSAEGAKAVMDELYKFAVDSPLTFEETVESARQLMAYGFQTGELVENMKMLGTVSLATGHSLSDVSYVYGTLKTQGRAYSRDLTQFAMRGIPIYEELSDVLKVNVSDIKKMTEEGKIGFREVRQAFQNMTADGGRFSGMLEERMKTLDGAMAQFGDTAQYSMGIVTKGITKVATISLKEMTESIKEGNRELTFMGKLFESVAGFAAVAAKAAIDLLSPLTELRRIMYDLFQMGMAGNKKLIDEFLGRTEKVKQNMDALAKSSFRQAEMALSKEIGARVIDPDALDNMMAELLKYQDELAKLRAQDYVERKVNIYAIAQSEYDLDKRNIIEKFKENAELKNQALAVANEIYTHQIMLIYKKDQEEKRLAKEKADRELQDLRDLVERTKLLRIAEDQQMERVEFSKKANQGWDAYSSMGGLPIDTLDNTTMAISLVKDALEKAQASAKHVGDELKRLRTEFDGFELAAADGSIESERLAATFGHVFAAVRYLNDELQVLLDREKELRWIEEGNIARDEARPIPSAFGDAPLDFNGTPLTEMAGPAMGTEVGKMAMGADPLTMAIMALVEFAMSIENVMKVLNPFATLFEAMRPIVEPLVNGILQPLVDILEMLGQVVAQILSPFLGLIQILMSAVYIISTIVMVPLQILGAAFAWLYDSVIVPVGNGFIDIVNEMIRGLNGFLGWLGVNIKELGKLKTTLEMTNAALIADAEKAKKAAFMATFEEMVRRLNAEIDKQISAYQDLYTVGAISGAQYENFTKGLTDKRIEIDAKLLAVGQDQLKSLESMRTWLIANAAEYAKASGSTVTTGPGGTTPVATPPPPPPPPPPPAVVKKTAGLTYLSFYFPQEAVDKAYKNGFDLYTATGKLVPRAMRDAAANFAVGTANIPSDQLAMVHQGEGIVPRTFMDAIRAGELTLGGAKGGTGSVNNIYITVEGSVMAENDMTDRIAQKLDQRVRRGYA